MARLVRQERNRTVRSFRQLRRFHHVINSDKVFGTHNGAAAYYNHRPSTSEPALQRSQSRAKYIASDVCSELFFAVGHRVEFGRPFHEGLVAVGDGDEPQRRHVIFNAHRAFENRIGAGHFIVRQRQQTLADPPAVFQPEVTDASDLVGREVLFDPAFGDETCPIRQTVKIANDRPDGTWLRGNDPGNIDLRHLLANYRLPSSSRSSSGLATGCTPAFARLEVRLSMSLASRSTSVIRPRLPPSMPISFIMLSIIGACTR